MASYLVTGGAGFIGSHLAEQLVRRGHAVRVVDSLITGKRANLAHSPNLEFIEGDLAEMDIAARAVAGIDDIRVTAKPDQLLVPLPEGASYLGFIFARADRPGDVDRALRAAHGHLRFAIDPEIPMVRYNQSNG